VKPQCRRLESTQSGDHISPIKKSIRLQESRQLLDSPGTVANLIFFFGRHFCKRPIVAFRNKNRVIAKSSRSTSFGNDMPFDRSLKEILFSTEEQRNDGSKPSGTCRVIR